MKRIQQGLLVLTALYVLYLIKTALGINISHRYHAVDLLKLPLQAIEHVMG